MTLSNQSLPWLVQLPGAFGISLWLVQLPGAFGISPCTNAGKKVKKGVDRIITSYSSSAVEFAVSVSRPLLLPFLFLLILLLLYSCS